MPEQEETKPEEEFDLRPAARALGRWFAANYINSPRFRAKADEIIARHRAKAEQEKDDA